MPKLLNNYLKYYHNIFSVGMYKDMSQVHNYFFFQNGSKKYTKQSRVTKIDNSLLNFILR